MSKSPQFTAIKVLSEGSVGRCHLPRPGFIMSKGFVGEVVPELSAEGSRQPQGDKAGQEQERQSARIQK